jgi:hypothetical protein
MISIVPFLALAASSLGKPLLVSGGLGLRSGCTIDSLASVAAAEKCSTVGIQSCFENRTNEHSEYLKITIDAFTVPAGQKLTISAPDKAIINMKGNLVVRSTTKDVVQDAVNSSMF